MMRNEVDIVSISTDATWMTDADLVAHVTIGFQKIREELPYILELRKRFARLPRGHANIAGCKTWKEFCIKILHRTDRHMLRVLANGIPDTVVPAEPRAPAPMPDGTYRVILADPPWDYGTNSFGKPRAKRVVPFNEDGILAQLDNQVRQIVDKLWPKNQDLTPVVRRLRSYADYLEEVQGKRKSK
jgi:hypothetical protein